MSQGLCSGEWITNITMYDQLRVPPHLAAGEYVLGFRWDCESSAQVWQACADITITAVEGTGENPAGIAAAGSPLAADAEDPTGREQRKKAGTKGGTSS